MSTEWNPDDLRVITEAAYADNVDGMKILRDHFGDHDVVTLGRACEAADQLRDTGAMPLGDGRTLERDAPDLPTGGAVRCTE